MAEAIVQKEEAVTALSRAYRVMTRKPIGTTERAIKEVVDADPRAAQIAMLQLEASFPDISDPSMSNYFNIYRFSPKQRQALKELLEKNEIYWDVKKNVEDRNNPTEFNYDIGSGSLIEDMKVWPPFLQLHELGFIKDTGLGRNIKLLAPTYQYEIVTGTVPRNHGYDQSWFKPTGISGSSIEDLGMNFKMPDWFGINVFKYNFIGVDYSDMTLTNQTEKWTEGPVGREISKSFRYESVLSGSPVDWGIHGLKSMFGGNPKPEDNVNSMVIRFEYTSDDITRALRTPHDPEIHRDIRTYEFLNTFGNTAAGLYWKDEFGRRIDLGNDSVYYSRSSLGWKGYYVENWFRLFASAEVGKYEQDSVAGIPHGEDMDPTDPSNPSVQVKPSGEEDTGNKISPDNPEYIGHVRAEIDMFDVALFNLNYPLTLVLDISRERLMWQEAKQSTQVGLNLGDAAGVAWSFVNNNVTEHLDHATGNQLTHKFNWFINIDLLDTGSKLVYDKSTNLTASFFADGGMMFDAEESSVFLDPMSQNNRFSAWARIGFRLGFDTALRKKGKTLHGAVSSSKAPGYLSPNNRHMMEEDLAEKDAEIRTEGRDRRDGRTIWHSVGSANGSTAPVTATSTSTGTSGGSAPASGAATPPAAAVKTVEQYADEIKASGYKRLQIKAQIYHKDLARLVDARFHSRLDALFVELRGQAKFNRYRGDTQVSWPFTGPQAVANVNKVIRFLATIAKEEE